MSAQITLLRHAETAANASDVWQGWGDAPLTPNGKSQSAAVGARLGRRHFDRVVGSDLGRAVATAGIAGFEPETDPAWRELEMGEWDGLARTDIFDRFPDQLAELRSGADIRWGGGETYGEFIERVDKAFDALADGLGDGDHALLVTHGGVVHALVSGLLGFRKEATAWPIGRLFNTSLTTISVAPDHRRLELFNDAAHLGFDAQAQHFGGAEIVLLRHGRTAANSTDRWHGTTDGPMSDEGERQAESLAGWRTDLIEIWASPLQRARRTAEIVATANSIVAGEESRLAEFDYGNWEDLTSAEIEKRYPAGWARYWAGEDVPRGETGETTSQVADRMHEAVKARANGSGRIGMVSHGGAIRSYVAWVLGLDARGRFLLGEPDNTSSSTIALTRRGPILTEYNLTPHLEE